VSVGCASSSYSLDAHAGKPAPSTNHARLTLASAVQPRRLALAQTLLGYLEFQRSRLERYRSRVIVSGWMTGGGGVGRFHWTER
jgi:hypothetical protein